MDLSEADSLATWLLLVNHAGNMVNKLLRLLKLYDLLFNVKS